MSFGGKGGGGGSGSYDYYGTIAGVVCVGPVDELLAVIADGKEVWPGSAPWISGQSITTNDLRAFGAKTWKALSDHTASGANGPPNPTSWIDYTLPRGASVFTDVTIVGYGTARLYWGTEDQVQEPLMAAAGNDKADDHPDYKGICYFVLKDFLFGRERVSAPNIEVIVRRKPNQSAVTGSASDLVDGQANPVAAIAEALTDPINGAGIPTANIDVVSFQAAADSHEVDPSNLYVSPLLNSQTTLRSFAADLSLVSDLWVRFNPGTGKIEAGIFEHGVRPAAYATISAKDLAGVPQIDTESWRDSRTGVAIRFPDRDRAFKDSSDRVDDLRAVNILGDNRRESMSRPHITRRAQAVQHAAEALRTFGRPQISAKLVVRRERARGIRPGDWVQLDIDLEPGGFQLLQIFKVTERMIPLRGPISLTLDAEETLTPIPYNPGTDPDGQLPSLDVPAIITHRVFDAPIGVSRTADLAVGILAVRESAEIVGFQPWFGINSANQNLGIHAGFAIAGYLTGGYGTGETGAIGCHFDSQIDSALLSVSISDSEAANQEFLLFVFLLDGSTPPQIDNDSDGRSYFEIFAVSAIASLGSGDYDITAVRAILGTKIRDHAELAECWLVRRSSLEFFRHKDFETAITEPIAEGYGLFKLQPFTAFATRPLEDCEEFAFFWPLKRYGVPKITVTTPDWSGNTIPWTEDMGSTGTTQEFSGYVEDSDNDLVFVEVLIRAAGGEDQVLHARTVPGVDFDSFSVSYTFNTVGTFYVSIRARDEQGLTSEFVVTINVASPGTKVLPPYLEQPDGTKIGKQIYFRDAFYAVIKCDTASSDIEYQFRPRTPGVSDGTWRAYTPGTRIIDLPFSFWPAKLFLRATRSGWTTSEESWVYLSQS